MKSLDKFGREIKEGDILVYGAGRGKIQVGIVVDIRTDEWGNARIGVQGTGRWSTRHLNSVGWLQNTQLTAVIIDRSSLSEEYIKLFATAKVKQ